MLSILAHVQALGHGHPGWSWSGEPIVALGLLGAAALYVRGRRGSRAPHRRRSDVCFTLALIATAAALTSPLDAMASELASAHMVQHVVLMLIAAPLFAVSMPNATIARGLPRRVLVAAVTAARSMGVARGGGHRLSGATAACVLYAMALWSWHSPILYEAAVAEESIHALEHACFFVSALLLWRVIVAAHPHRAVTHGTRLLLLFVVAMQSVFLSVLLTFAQAPWYRIYTSTTPAWGLDPLSDQQLAGAIMWVPAGGVYLAAALATVAMWLKSVERTSDVTA